MHTFLTSWLPNILCTISGCVVSWAIGYSQGSVSRRTLANLLHLQARAHGQEVIRDARGESTGEIEVPMAGPETTRLKTGAPLAQP
jgi:hypothetical protein